MSSIIPGYEYDIFISYRQKDNKYDGWVTEFVDNLKKELETHDVAENVNTNELGNLGLTDAEGNAIFAFMKTLSDGYVIK
jgi:hypothetical protein